MTLLTRACTKCRFDNPRAWPVCARCGHPTRPSDNPPQLGETDPTEPAANLEELIRHARAEAATTAYSEASAVAPFLPFLGQQTPRAQAKRLVHRALDKARPAFMWVQGAEGAGKTRFLMCVGEDAARAHSSLKLYYAARRPVESDGPYAPFSRLLRDRFGASPASSPSAVRATMAQTVGEVLQGEPAARVSEATHLLGHLAGIPFPDSPVLDSLKAHPRELRRRAAVALRRFVEGESQQAPVLLLLDDLALAEREAWDLVQAILDAKGPIAIVAAGGPETPEHAKRLRASGGVAYGQLEPWDDTLVAELVRARIPDLRELPDALVGALTHRSEGRPSAVMALLDDLRESGLFRRGEKGVDVDLGLLERGGVALSMEDALRARIARLSDAEHRVLQHAAIVGEAFYEGAVLALRRAERDDLVEIAPTKLFSDERDMAELRELLRNLRRKGLVERLERSELPGMDEYTFQHAGTRSLVYEQIPEDTRSAAHRWVARWLQSLQAQKPPELSAVLGAHLMRASLHAEASRAYLRAATEARRRMRTTMGLRYAQKALELVDEGDTVHRIDVLHEHGSLLTVLGRYDEATESFERMLRLAWVLGAHGKAGAALNRLARIRRQRGEHAAALDHLEHALAHFRAARDQRGVAATLDDLAQVHRLRGNLEPALAAASEALDTRVALQDRRGRSVSLNTIAFIQLDRGRFSEARRRFTEALELREAVDDQEGAVQTCIGLGKLAFQEGQLDEAVSTYTAALERAREMANRRFESYLLNHLGEALLTLGHLDEAEAQLEQARKLADRLKDQRVRAEIERNLGLVSLRRGDMDRARERIKHASELADEYASREVLAMAHVAQARLGAQTLFDSDGGDTSGVEEHFQQAIELLGLAGREHEMARVQAELGYYLLEHHEPQRARDLLEQARKQMKRMGLPEVERLERLA